MRRLIEELDSEGYIPQNAASSVERMQRPDHRAKKHSRPRTNEQLGGGHFVFRRGDHGRVHPNPWPFEHPSDDAAIAEAARLAAMTGGTFEVYSRISIAYGTRSAVEQSD
ncbi:hypothetical protein [Rhizobium sp. RCAM05973]|uniref:hypothetical protein n=1 Tax=Rhizobium sp. RCAM05973 TaxID=2994066 RepID=UPI0022EBDEC3|nr:hypothetical protein [Rhizobium sp. RCAM05973]